MKGGDRYGYEINEKDGIVRYGGMELKRSAPGERSPLKVAEHPIVECIRKFYLREGRLPLAKEYGTFDLPLSYERVRQLVGKKNEILNSIREPPFP